MSFSCLHFYSYSLWILKFQACSASSVENCGSWPMIQKNTFASHIEKNSKGTNPVIAVGWTSFYTLKVIKINNIFIFLPSVLSEYVTGLYILIFRINVRQRATRIAPRYLKISAHNLAAFCQKQIIRLRLTGSCQSQLTMIVQPIQKFSHGKPEQIKMLICSTNRCGMQTDGLGDKMWNAFPVKLGRFPPKKTEPRRPNKMLTSSYHFIHCVYLLQCLF